MKEISMEIQVRFRDLDAYGHVNNAVYLSYFEIARVELVRDMFVRDMANNIQYLLVGANLKYIQPVTLDDRLIADCRFDEVGKVRFKAVYRLHNGEGRVYATGYTEHAFFDGNIKRPMRIPEEFREFVNG